MEEAVIRKCTYLFIKKNLIRSESYLKRCLLLAKFKFPARRANKTYLKILKKNFNSSPRLLSIDSVVVVAQENT